MSALIPKPPQTVGPQGLSAYATAVANGFVGTEMEWILSLQGKSAYELAVEEGFVGSLNEWILSLQGDAIGAVVSIMGEDGTVNQLDYLRFRTTAVTPPVVGALKWNNTDGTLDLPLLGGNVVLQIGQEQVLRVRNESGGSLANGEAVYISGALSDRPTAQKAKADSNITSMGTIGIATEAIANNAEGYVTISGLVRDINTSAFSEGDELWLSASTAGAYVDTRPTAPNHSVRLGWCVRPHVSQGIILVTVDTGSELNEQHDVNIITPVAGHYLSYNAGGYWENLAPPAGGFAGEDYVDAGDVAVLGAAAADATSKANAAQAAAIAASTPAAHATDTANPHAVTKTQVGLGSADNTSDANKPVSTAQQTALDLKLNASDASVTNAREWTATEVSQAEAEAGTETTARKWTAFRVRQAIAAWWAAVTNIDGKIIGATTPAAGSFNSLSASGSVADGISLLTVSNTGTGSAIQVVGSSAARTRPVARFNQTNATGGTQPTVLIQQADTGEVALAINTDGSIAGAYNFSVTDTGNLVAKGNATLGDASTDRHTISGTVGIGATAQAYYGLNVGANTLITGDANPSGIYSTPTFQSDATGFIRPVQSLVRTQAAAFTVANAAGYFTSDASKGAGSTITSLHGLYVGDLTQGTNNYGISSQVSAGANKRNLNITGTADNYLAGNVGVGVAPSAWGSNYKALQLPGGSVSAYQTSQLWIGQNLYDSGVGAYTYANTAAATRYTQTAGQHFWHSAPSGTAGAAITFTQVLAVEKDKSLALQGATLQTGTGISFPATQVASSDANTLDDYEEGTFTPTVVGTTAAGVGTYSGQSGFYTKVGNVVHFTIRLEWSAHTGTGNLRVTGMPFVASSVSNSASYPETVGNNLSFSGQLSSVVAQGVSYIDLITFSDSAAISVITLDSAAGLRISGHYFV